MTGFGLLGDGKETTADWLHPISRNNSLYNPTSREFPLLPLSGFSSSFSFALFLSFSLRHPLSFPLPLQCHEIRCIEISKDEEYLLLGCVQSGFAETEETRKTLCIAWTWKDCKGLDREWLEGLCKLLLIYWAQKDQPSETSTSLLDGSLGPGITYLESSLGEWWGWLDNCRNLWWNSGILSMGWDGGPLLAHLWLHCFSLSVKLCNWIECSFECKRI